jgi:hypothetical protein
MSSEISTKDIRRKPEPARAAEVRLKADTTTRDVSPEADRPGVDQVRTDQGLQPWHFFVLAALGLSTALTFMLRGQGAIPVIMASVLMGSTALAGLSMWRLLRPLMSGDDDRTPMIGQRTRAALEREKMLALRAIKELDFDRAMGKLSESDWREMSGRLRSRAARLIRQLDAGGGYRTQIERDLAKRLAGVDGISKGARVDSTRQAPTVAKSPADRVCPACATGNDRDARFCKSCGQKLLV